MSRDPVGVFLGLTTLDVVHYLPHAPGPDEKATSDAHALAAGGPATNAAVAFAALGGRATLLTRLGADHAADLVRADLAACGVELHAMGTTADRSTPISSITVSTATGERSVVGSDAAGGAAVVRVDPEFLERAVTGADVLLLDGHHGDAALAAARCARTLGVRVVLDIGRWKPVFDSLVGLADDVVCSEGARPPSLEASGHAEVMAWLVERGVGTAVVTRGAAPVLLRRRGDDHPEVVDVAAVRAVDTLGAGDVFHGAYAYAVASGATPREAVEAAVAVAARKVTVRGPRAWLGGLGASPLEQ